jgi:hypothetical protein
MREGTKTAPPAEGPVDEELVRRAIAAARAASLDERVGAGLEAVIAIAEADPVATRSALVGLRADHRTLARIERCLGGSPKRAIFGLGGAIQLALSELSSPMPDLRGRRSELARWLEGGW